MVFFLPIIFHCFCFNFWHWNWTRLKTLNSKMPRVLGTCDTGWWKPLTSVEYKQCSIVSIIFLSVCLKNESNSDISWDQPWESWIVQYYFYFCYVGIQSCLFKLLKLRPKSTYLKLGLKSFSYIANCKEWEKVTYFDISWLIERKLTATPTGKYNYYTTYFPVFI